MKKLGLLCMIMVLFVSGCGSKKQSKDVKQDKNEKSGKLFTSRKMEEVAPQYEEETSNLFEDEDSVTSLALADDDFEGVDEELNLDADETLNFAAVDFDDNDVDLDQEEGFDAAEDLSAELQTASLDEMNDSEEDAADFKTASLDDLGLTFDLEEDTEDYMEQTPEFETVHHAFNKRDVLQEEKAKLEKNALLAKQYLEQNKDAQLNIVAHSCQIGTESQNLLISAQRAERLKKVFVEHGIPAERIKAVGLGYEAPLVWSNAQNREQKIKELALNRRSDISVS